MPSPIRRMAAMTVAIPAGYPAYWRPGLPLPRLGWERPRPNENLDSDLRDSKKSAENRAVQAVSGRGTLPRSGRCR